MIKNAKNTPLNQNSGTLPSLATALLGLFQQLVVSQIVKTTVNNRIVETATDVSFLGVWQLLSAKALSMKPEAQREWKWFRLHSDTSLELKNDEVITFLSVKYRVQSSYDFSIYGYFEYHLVEDYH